jgi:hypothetical protein
MMEGPAAGHFSRRRLIRSSLATAAIVASTSPFQAGAAPATPAHFLASINVGEGAGSPPLGAVVESNVPLPAGAVAADSEVVVIAPTGKPVPTQARVASRWPDGSARWLDIAFEALAGPGTYSLTSGNPPAGAMLLRQDSEAVRVDTGLISFVVSTSGNWLGGLSAKGSDGVPLAVVEGPGCCELLIKRHDGRLFRSSLAGASGKTIVEERGPLRCRIRLEGSCRSDDGEKLFQYSIRLTAYHGRPELLLAVTWTNTTPNRAEQIRDIRLTLPFRFAPERLVFGCDSAVYDGPFIKGWPVYLLQEDDSRYWAKTLNPDGRVQHLASGGADGARCPGWLYVSGKAHCLGVWIPRFWEEYPNEIAVSDGEISIGLWPERAAQNLAAKPVLPRNPFGEREYSNSKYWPVMPHPYVAFLDAERKCLDATQGLAKTQEIVLSLWGGAGDDTFEQKYWAKGLLPVRGHVDPADAKRAGAGLVIEPRGLAHLARFDRLFDENFGWLERHASVFRAYGKFDFGDFRYFTAASDYLCTPGTKWGEMGEMAREGYWHNNERDALRGLLLYYLRTANPSAWNLAHSVARHLFDVDIRHHPHWGMWTHSYGHCYLGSGEGGEPDHSWLAGMLLWAEMSGDPVALDAMTRCADQLADWHPDFRQSDARSVSVFLHMMCRFHTALGNEAYLAAARPAADALLGLQNADGGWPAYLANMGKPRIEGFVEHVIMALADYWEITRDERVPPALDRAFEHLFPAKTAWKADPGESSLALHGLMIMARQTGRAAYAATAGEILRQLSQFQNLSSDPRIRGDLWAEWGANQPGSKVPGRPPQFLGQTRPLSPVSILAYGQECLGVIASLPPRESSELKDD